MRQSYWALAHDTGFLHTRQQSQVAPAASLRDFDAAVCIANDTLSL